jgi:hypothetical protein
MAKLLNELGRGSKAAVRPSFAPCPLALADRAGPPPQTNLGNALSRLGERESGTAKLDEAVAAYREALKEWTRERAPLNWVRTQNNLGNALSILGQRKSGTGKTRNNLQYILKRMQEVKASFPHMRVRAVDDDGKLIDTLP